MEAKKSEVTKARMSVSHAERSLRLAQFKYEEAKRRLAEAEEAEQENEK